MRLKIVSLAVLLILVAGFTASAQTQMDPIQQLNLTPEQRQQIRRLTLETRDERLTTNRRVREAHAALDQALDADPMDENLVEQRLNELAVAQAAQTRMRVHMEMRIRRLLYPEQLATLKRLRLQVRDVMNPRRPNNRRRRNAGALRPNVRRP